MHILDAAALRKDIRFISERHLRYIVRGYKYLAEIEARKEVVLGREEVPAECGQWGEMRNGKPSFTSNKHVKYLVQLEARKNSCTCPRRSIRYA